MAHHHVCIMLSVGWSAPGGRTRSAASDLIPWRFDDPPSLILLNICFRFLYFIFLTFLSISSGHTILYLILVLEILYEMKNKYFLVVQVYYNCLGVSYEIGLLA